jgi:hypothetical protein
MVALPWVDRSQLLAKLAAAVIGSNGEVRQQEFPPPPPRRRHAPRTTRGIRHCCTYTVRWERSIRSMTKLSPPSDYRQRPESAGRADRAPLRRLDPQDWAPQRGLEGRTSVCTARGGVWRSGRVTIRGSSRPLAGCGEHESRTTWITRGRPMESHGSGAFHRSQLTSQLLAPLPPCTCSWGGGQGTRKSARAWEQGKSDPLRATKHNTNQVIRLYKNYGRASMRWFLPGGAPHGRGGQDGGIQDISQGHISRSGVLWDPPPKKLLSVASKETHA